MRKLERPENRGDLTTNLKLFRRPERYALGDFRRTWSDDLVLQADLSVLPG
jgi:hypothetical protein